MSDAFTPGPWAHTKSVCGGDVCFDIHQVEIDGKWVPGSDIAYTTLFRTYVAEHLDVQKANARLIAAAPELLEELNNCFELLDTCFSGAQVDSCIGVAITKARAAIAKATGSAA